MIRDLIFYGGKKRFGELLTSPEKIPTNILSRAACAGWNPPEAIPQGALPDHAAPPRIPSGATRSGSPSGAARPDRVGQPPPARHPPPAGSTSSRAWPPGSPRRSKGPIERRFPPEPNPESARLAVRTIEPPPVFLQSAKVDKRGAKNISPPLSVTGPPKAERQWRFQRLPTPPPAAISGRSGLPGR